MIYHHIHAQLIENLGYTATKGQERVAEKLSNFIADKNNHSAFIIKGYAGTGKTTLVGSLVKTLQLFKLKSVLLAPTGRAAKVLSSYTGKPAFTIHKKIYRQKSAKDGFGDFVIDANLHSNTFFIVDEASMITNYSASSVFGTGNLLDDLMHFVYNEKHCRLILVGDTAQLPPVGLEISPGLEKQAIESYGLNVTEDELNDVVRQSLNSGILFNATQIRNIIQSNNNEMPQFYLNPYKDIVKLNGNELIEVLSDSYDKTGIEETMVVTRSNKNANIYNQGIRNQILFRDEELSAGDYLMVVKNNYFWASQSENLDFIANGDIIEVMRLSNYVELYGFRFVNATIRLIDYNDIELDVKLMLDTLSVDSASLPADRNKEFFYTVLEDYQELTPRKKQFEAVKNNEFFNALQVKFAYAVTCHKAQGGQWENVFVDQGFFKEDMISYEYLRWLYTAVTRSTGKLYLINFHRKFFPEE